MSRLQKAVLLVLCVAMSAWSWGAANADLRSYWRGHLTTRDARMVCTVSLLEAIPVAGWVVSFLVTGAYYEGWSAQCGADKP